MVYDDLNKKWVPAGSSHGLSKVIIMIVLMVMIAVLLVMVIVTVMMVMVTVMMAYECSHQ